MAYTLEQAVVAVASAVNMTPQRVRDFLAPQLTMEDRIDILELYKLGQVEEGPSGWDIALVVLRDTAEVAGYIIPITGAIQAVFGLKSL